MGDHTYQIDETNAHYYWHSNDGYFENIFKIFCLNI